MNDVLRSMGFVFGVIFFVAVILPLMSVLGITVLLNLISLVVSNGWL